MAEQDSPPAPTEGCTRAQVEMLALYLKCTRECMEGVQKLPSPKFYNRQCQYLVEKLQKFVPIAGVVLDRHGSFVDAERRIEVLKLALVLAKRIESFVKSCSDDSFIQAAMALTNMSKCVASIGFDLELCGIALCKDDGCTARLTLNQVRAKYKDEVKEVEKKVLEDVKSLIIMVQHQLSEEILKNENRVMAIYLLRRLKRMDPTAPSIPSGSPLYIDSADQGILGAMYKLVCPSRVIGRGGSDTVTIYETTWLGTKVAKKTFVGRTTEFLMEAETLERLNHPNITSMFGSEMDRWSSSIIMEIMDGDLHKLMVDRCRRALCDNPPFTNFEGCDNPPFTNFEAVDIMLQIGEGVNYLHEEDICHRDLKSMNILVNCMLTSQSKVEVGYVHAKVADFGLSKTKKSTTFSAQTVNTGTYRWMAPEIIALDGRSQGNTSSEPRHPFKIDVHSFAMLCYEILTGYVPFHGEENPKTIKENIKRGIRPDLPKNCPHELKALIRECWDETPSKRPSFPDICSKLKYVKYLLMMGFCSSEDTQASTSVKSEATTPKIFVSYSPSDEAFGEQLSTDLGPALKHLVMVDHVYTNQENIRTILEEIDKCEVGVFVLSEDFFASKWQMVELSMFVRSGEYRSLRLIPLYYKVSRQEMYRASELWRPRWDKLARDDKRLDPAQLASCVRSLAAYNGLEFGSFGGSEMKYRHAIVEGIASCDRECEELAWRRMSPSCELYSEEASCPEREHEYQVFLSHVHGCHLPFIEQLDKELTMRNLSVFTGLQSVPLGEKFPKRVLGAVERCQVAVITLSDEYLSNRWPMIELERAAGRYCQTNNSIKIIPLFYKMSVNDLREESIQRRWLPRWVEMSRVDCRFDPKKWADAVRVLRTMKGLRLKDFTNSEVKYRHAIVEEIVQFLDTRVSEKKVSETPSLDGEGQSSV